MMTDTRKSGPSEAAANIVENVACRVAERCGGRISPNQLVPHLPLSLELIRACLDDMIDGTAVNPEVRDGAPVYEFSAYRDAKPRDGILTVESCVGCDGTPAPPAVLCGDCTEKLRTELNRLAETTAWPAQAVYEHEILYLAAQHDGPVHPEMIAGSSRYTLRSTRKKLDRLVTDEFASADLDAAEGVIRYTFPAIEYPRELYRANMKVIRSYPASLTEEIQLRMTRILFALGAMLGTILALAFWGVPFPALLIMFLVAAPVTSVAIWRHRIAPPEL